MHSPPQESRVDAPNIWMASRYRSAADTLNVCRFTCNSKCACINQCIDFVRHVCHNGLVMIGSGVHFKQCIVEIQFIGMGDGEYRCAQQFLDRKSRGNAMGTFHLLRRLPKERSFGSRRIKFVLNLLKHPRGWFHHMRIFIQLYAYIRKKNCEF